VKWLFPKAIQGGPRENWRSEEGGDVPAKASSLHMLSEVVIKAKWLKAQLRNAAILNSAVILVSH
jgi:hypothetical protein